MATDSRQISATLEIEDIEEIQAIAKKETKGSFSLMVALLLTEALQARKQKEVKKKKAVKYDGEL